MVGRAIGLPSEADGAPMTGPWHGGRFAFGPLERALVAEYGSVFKVLAGSTVKRYREQGVPAMSADRLACMCGMHPVDLWADWFVEETPSE